MFNRCCYKTYIEYGSVTELPDKLSPLAGCSFMYTASLIIISTKEDIFYLEFVCLSVGLSALWEDHSENC